MPRHRRIMPAPGQAVSFKTVARLPYAGQMLLILVMLLFERPGVSMLACAEELPAGLWPMANRDPQNTRRADVAGQLAAAPHEVWRIGHPQHAPSFAHRLRPNGREAYLLRENGRLELVRTNGQIVWHVPLDGSSQVMDVIGAPGSPRILINGGATIRLLDALTGRELWRWTAPKGVQNVQGWKVQKLQDRWRLFVFPCGVTNGTSGYGFEFADGRDTPRLLWSRNYAGKYLPNYGPVVLLADMDRDGSQEIVLASKPAYVAVIDSRTGDIKFDLAYQVEGGNSATGRPYGLVHAVDFDGDGYNDVVVASCQVEEYVAVLHNEAGKGLKLLWSQFVEKDFPTDLRRLSVKTTSVADIDGDGTKELVLGLYNLTGDSKWHTVALDPTKGLRAPLLDMIDRYFQGCYDLNGNGRSEIITSVRAQRNRAGPERMEVVDGRTGRNVAALDSATIVLNRFANAPGLPDNMAFRAQFEEPLAIRGPDGRQEIVIQPTADSNDQMAWRVQDGRGVLNPFNDTHLSLALMSRSPSESQPPFDLAIRYTDGSGGPAASAPRVAATGGKRELIVAMSDGTIVGGTPDLPSDTGFEQTWRIAGTQPAVWQGRDGGWIVVAVDPIDESVGIHEPGSRSAPVLLQPPEALSRRFGPIPFTDGGEFRLLVPLKRGLHSLAMAVYDRAGHVVWQDSSHGPYPAPPGVADLDGDGATEVILDDHGWQAIYDTNGKHRVFAQAWRATVPGRHDGSAYATPIIGPFGPRSQLRIVMSPGLMALETLDSVGQRLLKRDYLPDPYVFQYSRAAVGTPRGNGQWDIGMITTSGVFHCVDLATLQTRWRLDLGCPVRSNVSIVCGDVDGNGQEDFVVGLPNGDLIALAENPHSHEGKVLWKATLDYGIGEVILTDVDGDGAMEVIVSTHEGCVRVLR